LGPERVAGVTTCYPLFMMRTVAKYVAVEGIGER
jgi:hypothetical protein